MDKKELRKKYIEIRKNISEEDRKKQSDSMVKSIVELIEKNDFDSVFLYAPKEYEVDIIGVFDACKGIPVFFPRCEKDTMDFYETDDLGKLKPGSFNVKEPDATCKVFEYKKDAKILMIVPGVAFDEKGYRIGYGKGFYDKYFSSHAEYDIYKVGVCFKECFLKDVLHDDLDVKVDKTIVG